MTNDQRLERILASAGMFSNQPRGDHLPDEALAECLERGGTLSAEQQAHLASCAECRTLLGALLPREAAAPAPVVPLFGRRSALLTIGIAAGAAGIALVMIPPSPDYRGLKGKSTDLRGGVSLIATGASGTRRDLVQGDRITRAERLGFLYGNPKAQHQTLTILGWDGAKVHWYYPEKRGDAPFAIKGGPKVLSMRMPFDVTLEDHRPGSLVVVAAFDADPQSVAQRLRAGRTSTGEIRYELTLQEAR